MRTSLLGPTPETLPWPQVRRPCACCWPGTTTPDAGPGPGAAHLLFLVPICRAGGARVSPHLPLHLDSLPPPGQGLPCVPWAAPKDTCLPCHGMRVSSAPPPVLPRQIRVHPAKSYQKRLPDAQDHVSSGIIQWVQIKHVPAVGVPDGAGLRE